MNEHRCLIHSFWHCQYLNGANASILSKFLVHCQPSTKLQTDKLDDQLSEGKKIQTFVKTTIKLELAVHHVCHDGFISLKLKPWDPTDAQPPPYPWLPCVHFYGESFSQEWLHIESKHSFYFPISFFLKCFFHPDWIGASSLPVRYQDGADLRSKGVLVGQGGQSREGRGKNDRSVASLNLNHSQDLEFNWGKKVGAVLEMPCWWGCGEQEHRELKGPRQSLCGELQTGVDEGLDYKRGAALDQVISDSVDVGGKAAELWLWWWLLRSHRIVGSLTSNCRVLLIERCCWRRGWQWRGALHGKETKQVAGILKAQITTLQSKAAASFMHWFSVQLRLQRKFTVRVIFFEYVPFKTQKNLINIETKIATIKNEISNSLNPKKFHCCIIVYL